MLDSWSTRRLGDLFKIKHGYAFKGQFFTDSGPYILLTPGNFREEGGLKLRGDREKFYSGDVPAEFLLKTGDLLVAMTDLTQEAPILGSPAIVDADDRYLHNQRLGKIVDIRSDLITREYLFYLFCSRNLRERIKGSASGATVRHTSPSRISEIEVALPPLQGQVQIARALSAYDQMVENNLRRVRILDEMSRSIYRQWFIASRTNDPSGQFVHGDVSSLPNGWSRSVLATVCTGKIGIQTGPFGSQLHQSEYADEGIPVVMPKDLVGFRIDTQGIARVPPRVADRLARHKVQPGDILYGRRGDIGRRAFVMPSQAGWLCGTGCLRLRPDGGRVNKWFLFNYLGEADVVQLIAGRAHGVTLPNLNAGLMASVPVLLPPRALQDRFEEVTLPMAQLIETLLNQNAVLGQMRGLLLPRLLSGQLSLAEIKEDPVLAAESAAVSG